MKALFCYSTASSFIRRQNDDESTFFEFEYHFSFGAQTSTMQPAPTLPVEDEPSPGENSSVEHPSEPAGFDEEAVVELVAKLVDQEEKRRVRPNPLTCFLVC